MKSDGITQKTPWPSLGFGVGLRTEHFDFITSRWPKEADWFEAITENFIDTGGRPLQILEKVRSRYPIGLHGVSLSIGSADPLNKTYLKKLKILSKRIEPAIISDHLCWTGVGGKNLHDLLPLPFTEEALKHTAERISRVQEFLGKRILIENVSSYITYKHSHMPEWEFLSAVAQKSGCGILLDINNIYVNAVNHKFDADEYISSVPVECVGQFHLAGHTNKGDFLFDTHNRPVIGKVWDLYKSAVQKFGNVSALVEWDADIPEFPSLMKEIEKARRHSESAQGGRRISNVRSFVALRAPQDDDSYARSQKCHPREGGDRPDDSRQKIAGMTGQNSPRLAEIQRLFEESVSPKNSRSRKNSKFAKVLNPQGGAPGINRLSVYADGYPARIHEALGEAYPAVKHIVGESNFLQSAFEYSKNYPSNEYNLSRAGKNYARYLAGCVLSKKLPFLKDLAELEWQVAESFHEFQKDPVDLKDFSALSPEDWEHLSLVFQAAVRLLASEWPVLDIWNARNMPLKKIRIDLEGRPQNILVRRSGVRVFCELLDKNQFHLLKSLYSGKNLGKALEKSNVGFDSIGAWFAAWAAKNIFTGYHIKPEFRDPLLSVQG